MATTIPTLPVYTGDIPAIGQTQPTFNQNTSDKLAFDAQVYGVGGSGGELNATIEAMNTVSGEVEANAVIAEASATSAEQAAAALGYKGEWTPSTVVEIGGIYGYQSSEWRSLTGADVEPVEGDDWRKIIDQKDITTGQEELIDGEIFPKEGNLEVGMIVPTGTTHLRVGGSIYTMSPIATGVVDALTGSTVTIEGASVNLIPKSYDSSFLSVDSFYVPGQIPGVNASHDTDAFKKCFSACQAVGKRMLAPSREYTLNAFIGEIVNDGFYFSGGGDDITTIYNEVLSVPSVDTHMFTTTTSVNTLLFEGFVLRTRSGSEVLAGGFIKSTKPSPSALTPQKLTVRRVTMQDNLGGVPMFDAESGLGWHFEDFYAVNNSALGVLSDIQNFTMKRIAITDNNVGFAFTDIQYFDADNIVCHRNGSGGRGGMEFLRGESVNIRTGKCKATQNDNSQFYFELINTVNFDGTNLFGDPEYYAQFDKCTVINLNGVEIFPTATTGTLKGFRFYSAGGFVGTSIFVNGIMYRMQGGADFLSLFEFSGSSNSAMLNLSGYVGGQSISSPVVVTDLIAGANVLDSLVVDGLVIQSRDELTISSLGNTAACNYVSEKDFIVIGENAASQPQHFARPNSRNGFSVGKDGLGLRDNVSSVNIEDFKGVQSDLIGFSIPANGSVTKKLTISGNVIPGDSFVIPSISVPTPDTVTLTATCVDTNKLTITYFNSDGAVYNIPNHTARVLILQTSHVFYV